MIIKSIETIPFAVASDLRAIHTFLCLSSLPDDATRTCMRALARDRAFSVPLHRAQARSYTGTIYRPHIRRLIADFNAYRVQ